MSRKIIGIYCIENVINHKKYIGQSVDIMSRWTHHKSELNRNKHLNTYLQNAWNKYGEDNFDFFILEECTEEKLDELEKYYIKQNLSLSTQNGYNLDSGGKLNKHHSEETKRKMSQANTGQVISESTRRKISENRKGKTCGENHYMWGKKLPKEHVEKIRKYASSRHGEQCPQSKKVICLNTMEVFCSIREAANKYKCNETNLSRCCKGNKKYRYCGTFNDGTPIQWAFYEEGVEYTYKKIENTKRRKPVKQYTLNMEYINTFNSIVQAERETGISRYCISNVCTGNTKQAHGYIFKYA